MQSKTSEEARRDFRRLLTDTQRGIHTEITRYNEGVAAVVPVEWMDEMIRILRDLRQVEAGWDIYVPVERLREIAKAAAAILPATLDDEHAGDLDEQMDEYVAALKAASRTLATHPTLAAKGYDCHCGTCRSLPGRIVPLSQNGPEQASERPK